MEYIKKLKEGSYVPLKKKKRNMVKENVIDK